MYHCGKEEKAWIANYLTVQWPCDEVIYVYLKFYNNRQFIFKYYQYITWLYIYYTWLLPGLYIKVLQNSINKKQRLTIDFTLIVWRFNVKPGVALFWKVC